MEPDFLLALLIVLPAEFTSLKLDSVVTIRASTKVTVERTAGEAVVGVLVVVDAHPVRSPAVSSPRVRVVVRGESFNRFPLVLVGGLAKWALRSPHRSDPVNVLLIQELLLPRA